MEDHDRNELGFVRPAGWMGGRPGSPVLGRWLFKIGQIYVVPVILGAVTAMFLSVIGWKACAEAGARTPR